MKLNPEQQKAVDHFNGPCVVTAVPGSGKTSTLSSRVVSLIRSKNIDPRNILCTTFTNKAANEMRERVANQIGDISSKIFINTFHGLCLAILRKYGHLVGLPSPFSIYNDKDQLELLDKVARMREYEAKDWELKQLAKASSDFREETKNPEYYLEGLTPVQIEIVNNYIKMLDELQAVDFSGMLYKCWKLLQNDRVASRMSDRFKYVLVDEAQDMNDVQYEIAKSIASHGNIFFVGDPNQSIFSWRGARPEKLNCINMDFDEVSKIVLPRNYRSTPQILSVAEKLIRHNDNASDVELISNQKDGSEVVYSEFRDRDREADAVVGKLHRLHENGYKWSDFAILYRTNNVTQQFEWRLRQREIPYRIVGGFSFFDRKEIKTTIAYLNFLVNPNDSISFARAATEPKRGLGKVAIGKIERFCHENKVSVQDDCVDRIPDLPKKARSEFHKLLKMFEKHRSSTKPISKVAMDVLEESGYYDLVTFQSKKDEAQSRRLDNVNQLISDIADFQDSKEGATLGDYLQTLQIMTSDAKEEEGEAVSLLTMHGSKGLEFPIVFVVCLEHGLVPHYRAVQERGEDEERRLFYVAMTRSRKQLFLTRSRSTKKFIRSSGKNIDVPVEPSQFLFEIDVV